MPVRITETGALRMSHHLILTVILGGADHSLPHFTDNLWLKGVL